jgi:hypothetical protein
MRTTLFAIVIAVSAATGCSKGEEKTEQKAEQDYPKMTLDEVEAGIAANTLTAVDCNGDKTRKKYGAVPGAVLITDEESYPESELPADKTRKLVFYCSDAG